MTISAPIKAYSYIRFSTRKQELGDSLRRQHELSVAYARKHNLALQASSYRDLGISAFRGENAKKGKLYAFLRAAEAGRIEKGSYLLVESLDRLSRSDIYASLALFQEILSAGITIVTLIDDQKYTPEDKGIEKLIQSLLIFSRAHGESIHKSQRLKEVWAEKRSDETLKVLTAECPKWLRVREDRQGFEVIKDRVESIEKVFELTIAGYGSGAITRKANQEKWPVPGKGSTWHASLITRLLSNKAVLGIYQPMTRIKEVSEPVGLPRNGYYPSVIHPDTFNLAAALRSRRAKLPRRRDENYRNFFQGILKCGTCGASLVRKNKSSSNQLGYAIYMCAQRVRGLTKCDSLNALHLEAPLIEHVFKTSFHEVSDDGFVAWLRETVISTSAELDAMTKKVQLLADLMVAQLADYRTHFVAFQEAKSEQEAIAKRLADYQEDLAKVIPLENRFQMSESLQETLSKMVDPDEIEFRAKLREKLLFTLKEVFVFPERRVAIVEWNGARGRSVAMFAGADADALERNPPVLPSLPAVRSGVAKKKGRKG